MTRRYQSIWEKIKSVPVGTEVPVKCHATAAKTLKKAVIKEKSEETAAKKKLGMLTVGNLEIREVSEGVKPTGYVIIYFKKSWGGNLL